MQFRVKCNPSWWVSQDTNLIFQLQVLHSFPQIIKANMLQEPQGIIKLGQVLYHWVWLSLGSCVNLEKLFLSFPVFLSIKCNYQHQPLPWKDQGRYVKDLVLTDTQKVAVSITHDSTGSLLVVTISLSSTECLLAWEINPLKSTQRVQILHSKEFERHCSLPQYMPFMFITPGSKHFSSYGMNYVSSIKFVCWNSKPQYLKLWLYLETRSSKRQLKLNEVIRVVSNQIQGD